MSVVTNTTVLPSKMEHTSRTRVKIVSVKMKIETKKHEHTVMCSSDMINMTGTVSTFYRHKRDTCLRVRNDRRRVGVGEASVVSLVASALCCCGTAAGSGSGASAAVGCCTGGRHGAATDCVGSSTRKDGCPARS